MGCGGSCQKSCCASDAPVGVRWQARELNGAARYVTTFEQHGVAPPPFSVGRPPDPERVLWLPDGPTVPWPDRGLPFQATAETPLQGGLRSPPAASPAPYEDYLRVKIYVVAGPLTGACRHLDQTGCNLYEIDWPIPAGTSGALLGTYIRRLVADPVARPGVAKPDVHHTRPVVAYSHIDPYLPASGQNARLEIVDLVSGAERPWAVGAPLGHASAWGVGDTLWHNQDYVPVPEDPRYQALWSGTVVGLGTAAGTLSFAGAQQWFRPGDPIPAAGYCSFGWPATNPAQPELVAIQTVWKDPYQSMPVGVETCPFFLEEWGVTQNTNIVQFPAIGAVMDVLEADARIVGTQNPWELGTSWWQVGFVRAPQYQPAVDQPFGAAHADWSPDGGTVAYFEQEGPTLVTQQEVARTFGYAFDGAQYSPVRLDGGNPDIPLPLYDHPDVASLPAPANAFAADCVHYFHKYARFCGAPGDARVASGLPATMMVVSVGCEDFGKTFVRPSYFNRVYLVDFSDAANPIYEDLTTWIELFEDPKGLLYGTFGGTQADCGRWYASFGGLPLPPEAVWPVPPAVAVPPDGSGSPSDVLDFKGFPFDLPDHSGPSSTGPFTTPSPFSEGGVVPGVLHRPGVFP